MRADLLINPRHRRPLATVVVFLAVLALVVAVGVSRQRSRPTFSFVDQARPGPVLLVPGYGGSTASLEGLAATLRSRGHSAAVLTLAGDGTGDLRVQAQRLAAAATAAIAAGAPSVDVVGYSAGGVVARIWAADFGGARQARRIVTLGSPHHGTRVAELGATLAASACPVACQQLVPGSALLDALDESANGPVWTSLWTAQDEVVTPPDSARLDGALSIEVQSVCSDARVPHGQLPRDPLVVGLLERALAVVPLTAAPASDQCAAVRAEGAVVR